MPADGARLAAAVAAYALVVVFWAATAGSLAAVFGRDA